MVSCSARRAASARSSKSTVRSAGRPRLPRTRPRIASTTAFTAATAWCWKRRSGSLMRAAPIGNTRKRAIEPSSSEDDPKARQNCSGVAMPNRQRCGQSIGSGSRPA